GSLGGHGSGRPRPSHRQLEPRRSGVQLGEQGVDPLGDLVADGANGVEVLAVGVGEVAVEVAAAGDVGALVAAAHRDDDIGPAGVVFAELVRDAVGEIDVELAHHLHDLGVDVVGRGGAGGA